VNSAIRTVHMLHCSVNSGVCLPYSLNNGHMPPLFSEQWRHDTLFSEQCIMPPLFTKQCSMVELRATQESSIFLLSICLRFAHNLLWDPCTVNNFFFLTKHLLSAFLKKRNLYLVAKWALN
jgi:hypothetical protein